MIFPVESRLIPLGFPRSVWGICQLERKTPFEENFCTRPVMSTTNKLSLASTATDRGLLNFPAPAPWEPINCTLVKSRLSSFGPSEPEQPASTHAPATAYKPRAGFFPQTILDKCQRPRGNSASARSNKQRALT